MVPIRSPLSLLLPAAAVCGFGLGSLALALVPADLPPDTPGARAPGPAPAPVIAAPAPEPWPALFGTIPAPEPEAGPEPEPLASAPARPEPEPPPPRPQARLRGLALDEGGGWALVDLAEGITLVRPGTPLAPGHTVAEISAEGVLVAAEDGAWLLGFAEPEPGAAPVRHSLPRALMGGIRTFTDESGMPMQLPPAGYQSGPGPQGGDMR